jgi:hypothetical protein
MILISTGSISLDSTFKALPVLLPGHNGHGEYGFRRYDAQSSPPQFQSRPSCTTEKIHFKKILTCNIPDLDPYSINFGPPGSESVSQWYGSDTRSFHHQAYTVRKIYISTVLKLLYDFLSLKNDVNVPSKKLAGAAYKTIFTYTFIRPIKKVGKFMKRNQP